MPRRYLELEEQRLVRLVTEWLDYESARIEFEVTETEAKRSVELAGLTFDLRLDRLDRLNDDSLLVIDYKSGAVTPKSCGAWAATISKRLSPGLRHRAAWCLSSSARKARWD